MHSIVASFLTNHWNVPLEARDVRLDAMPGGLESLVARVHVRAGERTSRLIVKQASAASREAEIYDWLWARLPDPPLPRVLGCHRVGPASYLFLEDVRGCSPWPWDDLACAEAVCRALARLHDDAPIGDDARLADARGEAVSAVETLAVALATRDTMGGRVWRRPGDLRRVVAGLPTIRARLAADGPVLLHGDVHPGNVLLAEHAGRRRVVFIDWGRSRRGAPLEDVASWLHALGCWEPRARRRHDHLLKVYLDARRERRRLDAGLRATYWLASARNALSGAIRHHLAVVTDPAVSDEQRWHGLRGVRAWERVIRRAAEVLATSRAH